jgi:hypothetical protein
MWDYNKTMESISKQIKKLNNNEPNIKAEIRKNK